MDSPSTGFGLFQFASLEPSLLNYTPSPYRSPSNSRTRNLVYSPVKTLGIEASYEAIKAVAIFRELEESLGLCERPPVSLPDHLEEVRLSTASVSARSPTTPDEESDDLGLVLGGHTNINGVRRRSVTPTRCESSEEAPEPPSLASTSFSLAGSSVEVAGPSIVRKSTNKIQSQVATETGGSSINAKGSTVFPRPTNKRDVLFLLGEGVHVSQFVEHKRIGSDWYCNGKYALKQDGRFLLTRTPCKNMKLSSKDNLDRHVKREHLNMKYDVSAKVLGLPRWAEACGYRLPRAKRHSTKCSIDWAAAGSYPAPKSVSPLIRASKSGTKQGLRRAFRTD